MRTRCDSPSWGGEEWRYKRLTLERVQFLPAARSLIFHCLRIKEPWDPTAPTAPPKALAAQSCLICQPVLEGKFVFQTLKNQHLGWQQYSGNWYNLILPHILISFPLLTVHTHDCCPAQYFNLELQFLKTSVKYFCYIKVPCFEEPMGVEKVSLEMSLNYNFNLFALCDKYIWLY